MKVQTFVSERKTIAGAKQVVMAKIEYMSKFPKGRKLFLGKKSGKRARLVITTSASFRVTCACPIMFLSIFLSFTTTVRTRWIYGLIGTMLTLFILVALFYRTMLQTVRTLSSKTRNTKKVFRIINSFLTQKWMKASEFKI